MHGTLRLLACEQALPFGQGKRASGERASEGLRLSLARSRETRFARPNSRACSQAMPLFPVFISPIVWNMCEHLHYESVYFKELHKEQEYYIQSGGSCSVNYY